MTLEYSGLSVKTKRAAKLVFLACAGLLDNSLKYRRGYQRKTFLYFLDLIFY
jgi:hypothetical protein